MQKLLLTKSNFCYFNQYNKKFQLYMEVEKCYRLNIATDFFIDRGSKRKSII